MTTEQRLRLLERKVGIREGKETSITCKSRNLPEFKVLVVDRKTAKELENGTKNVWWTTDTNSEVGEEVVIENTIGARVTSKRVK